MHQIRLRLGLCPRPRWGSLQRSPRPPSWIWGPLRGRGRVWAGEEEGGEGIKRGPQVTVEPGPLRALLPVRHWFCGGTDKHFKAKTHPSWCRYNYDFATIIIIYSQVHTRFGNNVHLGTISAQSSTSLSMLTCSKPDMRLDMYGYCLLTHAKSCRPKCTAFVCQSASALYEHINSISDQWFI